MPALRPLLSDFYLALAKPTATFVGALKSSVRDAITRASVTFVLISHAELSGLRQGTLEAWNLNIRRAPLETCMRDTQPPNGSATADAHA